MYHVYSAFSGPRYIWPIRGCFAGDVAVLLSSGWSTKKVLIMQLLSQATAFAGLYIGIALAENSSEAQEWIFAITFGMFLYIALANVVS